MHPLVSVAAGVLAADFVTALGHWFEDTYLSYTTAPGLLGNIARDNELHHYVPYTITAVAWWDNVRTTVGLLAAAAVPLLLLAPAWARDHGVFLVAFAVAAALAPLVHRFQHERDCRRPALVTALMRAGLLCSRDQHRVHHQRPDGGYCVLLAPTNHVYDGLGVWRGLEALVALLTGARPQHKRGAGAYDPLHDDWMRRAQAAECPERMTRQRRGEYIDRLAAAHAAGQLPQII